MHAKTAERIYSFTEPMEAAVRNSLKKISRKLNISIITVKRVYLTLKSILKNHIVPVLSANPKHTFSTVLLAALIWLTKDLRLDKTTENIISVTLFGFLGYRSWKLLNSRTYVKPSD